MGSITSKLSPVSPIIGKENTDLTFFLLSLGRKVGGTQVVAAVVKQASAFP